MTFNLISLDGMRDRQMGHSFLIFFHRPTWVFPFSFFYYIKVIPNRKRGIIDFSAFGKKKPVQYAVVPQALREGRSTSPGSR